MSWPSEYGAVGGTGCGGVVFGRDVEREIDERVGVGGEMGREADVLLLAVGFHF